jgi:hypothetical protein
VKRARPREGTGEARLLHGRTTADPAEVAECLAERVAAVRVVRARASWRPPAGLHRPRPRLHRGVAKEADKASPPAEGVMGGSPHTLRSREIGF